MSTTAIGTIARCETLIATDKVKSKDIEVDNSLIVDGNLGVTGTSTLKITQADTLFLTTGALDINGLATSNPGIGGRVWNDGGTLKIVP